MATTAPASAPITRPAGPGWLPSCSNKAESNSSNAFAAQTTKAGTAKGSCASRKPNRARGATIAFGREICNDLAAAEQREWLVTNGIGGFASGTVAGSATRRYHGLLVAALKPPAGRTLLVGGLDEIVSVDGKPRTVSPLIAGPVARSHLRAISRIQSFRLEGLIPVWTYQVGSARIEKRIWMRHGENTTFVQYTLLDSSSPVSLELKATRELSGFSLCHSCRRLAHARRSG